jgi:hypothetical protein
MPRLTKQDLREIKQLLQGKSRKINQIAKFYGVSRHSIYALGWRRGWIKRGIEKKQGLWEKVRKWLIQYLYGVEFPSQTLSTQRIKQK